MYRRADAVATVSQYDANPSPSPNPNPYPNPSANPNPNQVSQYDAAWVAAPRVEPC